MPAVFGQTELPLPVIEHTGVGFTVIVNATGSPVQPDETKLPNDTGPEPTLTVLMTLFVTVLITDTLLLLVFATYKREPSADEAMPAGPLPTVIAPIIALVAVLIIETVFELELVTYSLLPSALTISASGALPTAMVDETVLLAVL